jgi:cell wall-associated NlpC family hydrolase
MFLSPRRILLSLVAAPVVIVTGAASASAATSIPAGQAARSVHVLGSARGVHAARPDGRRHKRHRAPAGRSKARRALLWAYRQKGKPYQWGGTGPAGFDCSGLVYEAYRHQGINVGRDTSQMLASRRIYRVSRPHPGDLAFYGSGHVELYVRSHQTFGAEDSGTRIGWHRWSVWWHPTMFFRVRGAA